MSAVCEELQPSLSTQRSMIQEAASRDPSVEPIGLPSRLSVDAASDCLAPTPRSAHDTPRNADITDL